MTKVTNHISLPQFFSKRSLYKMHWCNLHKFSHPISDSDLNIIHKVTSTDLRRLHHQSELTWIQKFDLINLTWIHSEDSRMVFLRCAPAGDPWGCPSCWTSAPHIPHTDTSTDLQGSGSQSAIQHQFYILLMNTHCVITYEIYIVTSSLFGSFNYQISYQYKMLLLARQGQNMHKMINACNHVKR